MMVHVIISALDNRLFWQKVFVQSQAHRKRINTICVWRKWEWNRRTACVPMWLCSADMAKHEIGPLITNMWPLILIFHFLLSSLSPYPSSSVFLSPPALSCLSLPSITALSLPFSLSISFSLHTFSIFYSNILNPTLHFLSLSPFLSSQTSLSIFSSITSLTFSPLYTLFQVFPKF